MKIIKCLWSSSYPTCADKYRAQQYFWTWICIAECKRQAVRKNNQRARRLHHTPSRRISSNLSQLAVVVVTQERIRIESKAEQSPQSWALPSESGIGPDRANRDTRTYDHQGSRDSLVNSLRPVVYARNAVLAWESQLRSTHAML
jgi:hypothetical protein